MLRHNTDVGSHLFIGSVRHEYSLLGYENIFCSMKHDKKRKLGLIHKANAQ